MQFKLGDILEGKVKEITNYGAFVDIGDGKTGMVHISEVSHMFVNKIQDYISEGETVKVKIINITDHGKIALSIKKATPQKEGAVRQKKNQRKQRNGTGWQGFKKAPEPKNFEDMMSKFKQASDEKMSDLKRVNESKRGGFSRRNSHGR